MATKLKLTNKELDIMNTLWNVGTSLTVAEICCKATEYGLSLNQSTVAVQINKLIKKKFIEVNDIKQTTTNYARTFVPKISREDYALSITKETFLSVNKEKRANFIASLLNDEEYSHKELDEIISLIEELKR